MGEGILRFTATTGTVRGDNAVPTCKTFGHGYRAFRAHPSYAL